MTPAFVIQARDKAKFIGKAVQSALSQIVPCEIILSDQGSTDGTYEVMEQIVHDYLTQRGEYEGYPPFHTIKLFHCPIVGPYGMEACNAHFDWAWRQASPDCDIIFQLSGDDYSFPDRVRVCLDAIKDKPFSGVATTMYFENPESGERQLSGYPTETGYVNAGEGLEKLAYGSVIAAWSREFLEKVSHRAGHNTPDVLWGYLAALDKGFYVVANALQVHGCHASLSNMGFKGKMRAATGEDALCIAELNHFQLLRLYESCAALAQEFHPEGIDQRDWTPLMNMMLGQSIGWLRAREVLHQKGITPWTM